MFSAVLVSTKSYSQDIETINFEQLEELWDNNDTLYVVNFWATWCQPCVEELPDFMRLNNDYQNEKFKMILVSLDFPKHINTRVKPFLKQNNINTKVVLLDDDPNIWINLISKNWDGAIPATLFLKNNKRAFHPKQLTYKQLITITQNLQQNKL